MKKLIYLPLNLVFNLKSNYINSIVIENPRLLENMVVSLSEQINKNGLKWTFLHDEKEKAIDKYCDLVFSPVELVFDKREVQKKLFAYIIEEIEEDDLIEELTDIHGKTIELLEKIRSNSEFALEFNDELVMLDFLKYYDIQLKKAEGIFVERLMEYVEIIRTLTGKLIYIFVGCSAYLSDEDYIHLDKWIKYQQVSILFLESGQIPLKIEKNEYIIDKDLCEIY